jgi:acetate kinase
MTTAPVILCLNSGSSSLKFALYQLEAASDTTLAEGSVERIGLPIGRLWVHDPVSGAAVDEPGTFHDHPAGVQAAFAAMEKLQLPALDAVGHRIVHGGAEHIAPERVDGQLLEDLRRLIGQVS